MKELYLYRQTLLEHLGAVVEELAAAINALPPERLHTSPVGGGVSPHNALAHLRTIEAQALAPRLERILAEDHPRFELFDDQQHMEAHYDPSETVDTILQDYARIRRRELDLIAAMPLAGWNRTARHPWFGQRTFQWYVERTLVYAREHLAQIQGDQPPDSLG